MGLNAAERDAALVVARQAAEAAGAVLLQHFGRIDRTQLGRKSARRDLVSAADLASERLLVSRLRAAFPEHAIEAEEEVRDAPDERPRWFLDPLDGTINFVHGLPCFAVSLGLWCAGEAQVGVVHLPLLGECFHACRGAGAFLGDTRLAVSCQAELPEALLATGFPYRRNELAAQGLEDNLSNVVALYREVRDLRRMGSAAVDLAYVAAGRLDGYWELHLAPHDVAAGGLLVREAGGLVSDLQGGQDWLRGGSILASGPALHAQLRARLCS